MAWWIALCPTTRSCLTALSVSFMGGTRDSLGAVCSSAAVCSCSISVSLFCLLGRSIVTNEGDNRPVRRQRCNRQLRAKASPKMRRCEEAPRLLPSQGHHCCRYSQIDLFV
ncbi:hypothetical protein IWX91DRAFT_352920 [Phyllosticta citricarpa]